MSAALIQASAGTLTTPTRALMATPLRDARGSVFPVGARFPRRTATVEAAHAAAPRIPAPSAPLFPVGARFPRRTQADAIAYLTEQLTVASFVATRPTHPIGARFPRR